MSIDSQATIPEEIRFFFYVFINGNKVSFQKVEYVRSHETIHK